MSKSGIPLYTQREGKQRLGDLYQFPGRLIIPILLTKIMTPNSIRRPISSSKMKLNKFKKTDADEIHRCREIT